MGLAVALLAMTTLAVALLLLPLILRGRRAETRDAYNLAVYRDQLGEVERDLARGIIAPEEAEAAKSEIGRRILALTPAAAPLTPSATPQTLATIAVILLLMPHGRCMAARLAGPARSVLCRPHRPRRRRDRRACRYGAGGREAGRASAGTSR